MANTKSAKKCIRQTEKKRIENKSVKSATKTAIKKVLIAVEEKDKDAAVKCLSHAMKCIDKAAKQNIFHKNNAARKKARLAREVNSIG